MKEEFSRQTFEAEETAHGKVCNSVTIGIVARHIPQQRWGETGNSKRQIRQKAEGR